MGGDIIGKIAVPIIQEAAGRYRATLQGTTEIIETEEALKALLERIGMLGFYAKVMTEEEYRALSADPAEVDALFHSLARQRLESWIELSETRLGGTGIKCYVTGGNDDYPDVLEVMKTSGAQTFIDCEGVVVPIDDRHTMISVGNSTPTPWKTPREVTDEELGRIIDGMIAKVTDMKGCVFNFHDPPEGFDARHLPRAGLEHRSAGADRQSRATGHARRGQPVRAQGDRDPPAGPRPARPHSRIRRRGAPRPHVVYQPRE